MDNEERLDKIIDLQEEIDAAQKEINTLCKGASKDDDPKELYDCIASYSTE